MKCAYKVDSHSYVQLILLLTLGWSINGTNKTDRVMVAIHSPIQGSFYIQQTGSILVHASLGVEEGAVISLEARMCTTFFEIIGNGDRTFLEKECSFLQDQKLPNFMISSYPLGVFEIEIQFTDVKNDHNCSSYSLFYVGRKLFKQYVLSNRFVNNNIMILGIKYGIHGDDSSVSFAVDGKIVFKISLSKLFQIDSEYELEILTESQRNRRSLGPNDITLQATDVRKLSHHLALQTATGFGNGCTGIMVTTSGVRRVCDDVISVTARWRRAAERIQQAIALLYGNAIPDTVRFDALVFVAGEGDLRSLPDSPISIAQSIFHYKRFAVDDDTMAVGDPALVVWANLPDINEIQQENLSQELLGEPPFSLGITMDDRLSPQIPGLTGDTTEIITRKVRQLRLHSDPFTVCRPGLGWDTTLAHRRLTHPSDTVIQMELALLREHAGVSTSDVSGTENSDINLFLDVWNEVFLENCDVVAVWPATIGRVSEYCAFGLTKRQKDEVRSERSCITVDARTLGGEHQLLNQDSWLKQLKDLRVLIIHPFAASIKAQYKKHLVLLEKGQGGLFPNNPGVLPVFKSLIVMTPPVGNRKHWLLSLNSMREKIALVTGSFDIALISSGGWGPAIQGLLKQSFNKSSVYMGGSLQLHFGVWGGRYNNSRVVRAISTDHWTWPDKNETQLLKDNLVGAFNGYATPDITPAS